MSIGLSGIVWLSVALLQVAILPSDSIHTYVQYIQYGRWRRCASSQKKKKKTDHPNQNKDKGRWGARLHPCTKADGAPRRSTLINHTRHKRPIEYYSMLLLIHTMNACMGGTRHPPPFDGFLLFSSPSWQITLLLLPPTTAVLHPP